MSEDMVHFFSAAAVGAALGGVEGAIVGGLFAVMLGLLNMRLRAAEGASRQRLATEVRP